MGYAQPATVRCATHAAFGAAVAAARGGAGAASEFALLQRSASFERRGAAASGSVQQRVASLLMDMRKTMVRELEVNTAPVVRQTMMPQSASSHRRASGRCLCPGHGTMGP